MSYEAEVVEEVIGRTRSFVHLVGHSHGALVALAVALRGRAPLASLTVIEAPAMELLRDQGEERDYEVFRRMTESYFAAFEAGDREAIGEMIDFYGGPGTFASWPQRVRNYAVETTAVNILDWSTAFGFALTGASLAQLDLPVLIIRGGSSPAAVQRANALVAQHIRRAELVTIEDASHFLIASHANEVSALITEHVARHGNEHLI
jgi:pimeloyl-ACP methyl ester carboxylesterase